LFVYYLSYLVVLFIFYKVAIFVSNYLMKKSPKTAIYAHLTLFYIIGIPFFIFLFWNNLEPIIFYNLFYLYGLCSLKNFVYLYKYLNTKIKYSTFVSIVIIYLPIFFITLSQINNLSKFIIIVEGIIIVLLSIMHLFISIKLSKK